MGIGPHRATALLLGLFATSAAAAQTTWIVDASGGGQFTDIAPAEAVAAPGDIIRVRAGIYRSFTTSKGIAVLGEPGVRLIDSTFFGSVVAVQGLPAGQVFSMRNVEVEFADFTWGIDLSNNDGRVHLHAVKCTVSLNSTTSGASAVRATSCREVTLNECELLGAPALFATDAAIVASSSILHGASSHSSLGGRVTPSGYGAQIARCELWLSRTEVRGGHGLVGSFLTEPPRSAIGAHSSPITLTGDTTTLIAAGTLAGAAPLAAIVTDGATLAVDPDVVIAGAQGGAPITGTSTVDTRQVVSLAARGSGLSGPILFEIVSPPGDLISMLISLPSDPLPTPLGTVFFDPAFALGLFQARTQNLTGRSSGQFGLPALPSLRGVAVVLQVANFYRATGFLELSNPAVLVLD